MGSEINTKDLLEAIAAFWIQQDPLEGESVPHYGQALKKATEDGHYLRLGNEAEAADNNIPKDDFGR